MKKKLIALALFGAFSGAALAQSNVTLYGILDVNFQYNDPDLSGASSTRGINSGHQSGSRWGIRGSEALSPNLNAVFTAEGGMNVDTGTSAQSGQLFGRQIWAGLSGGWGTVVAGRLATFSSGTGSFDLFGNTDPFLTGFGDSSLGSTFTPSSTLRVDNAVLYSSPTFGGFKFGAGYTFNGFGGEGAGSGNNNRGWFFGASFASGPFFAAATYDIIDVIDTGVAGGAAAPRLPTGASDQRMLQLGATFDLKFLKLHAGYAKEDSVWLTTGFALQPDAGADADAWMGGITVPLGGGSLLGSYQKRLGDSVNVCLSATVAGACPAASVQNRERDVRVWAVGYTYPLSRRTNLYATYSDRDEELLFSTAGVPTSGRVDQQRPAVDRKQYTVGVRHLF